MAAEILDVEKSPVNEGKDALFGFVSTITEVFHSKLVDITRLA